MHERQIDIARRLIPAAIAATGRTGFQSGGRSWPFVGQEDNTAPTVRAVDYLHGTAVLARTSAYLFGVTSAAQATLARIDKATYAATGLVSLSSVAGYVSGMSIQCIFVYDENTLFVDVWKSGTNSILVKVTTTDGWATAAAVTCCYLGADNPTAGGACTAGGTNLEFHLLSQHSMCVRASDRAIFLAEYQSQDAGVRVRILKSVDAGATWTTVWSLNGSGVQQIRHFHTIGHNPYTGRLWIGTGDADTYTGVSTSDEPFILDWDGTTPLVTDTIPSWSSATRILHDVGTQRLRAVQFLFRSEGVYYWSDSDANAATAYISAGIWRVAHDLSSINRVSVEGVQDQPISGYYAMATAGSMVFCPAVNGTTSNRAGAAPIVTSKDGNTFVVAGQYGLINDGATKYGSGIPYGAIYDSTTDRCFVSYSNASGKTAEGTMPGFYKTAVFQVLDNTPHVQVRANPETIHPVYWFGAAGAAGNTGYSPGAAKATLAQLMQSSVATHGGAIRCLDATYTLDATNAFSSANWSANAAPGYAHEKFPLELNFRGTTFTYNRATTGYGITTGAYVQHLRVFAPSLVIGANVNLGGTGLIDASANAGGSLYYELEGSRVARAGAIGTKSCGALFYVYGGKVTINRSVVSLGGLAGYVTYSVSGAGGAALTTRVVDSVIENCGTMAYHARPDDVEQIEYSVVGSQWLGSWQSGTAYAGSVYAYRSALKSAQPTGGSHRFWTGTNKPGTQAFNPFTECVMNCTLDPSITVTNPSLPELNAVPSLSTPGVKSFYAPLDPFNGDWRDPAYPDRGPRYRLPALGWSQ